MSKKMSREEFKEQIETHVAELSFPARRFFAWLCAVRALPFLSTVQNFTYWQKYEIQSHLQSIFYALDIAALGALYGEENVVFTVAVNAVNTTATATADDIAIAVVFAVSFAADGAAVNAADAANIASENASAIYPNETELTFQEIILHDIETLKNNQQNKLHNDISLYGQIWQQFQHDMISVGCEYWSTLYTCIFENNFQLDIGSLKQRINVPLALRKQGAATVARYLKNAEIQGSVYIRRETRVVILGSAGAGKTTLARRLNSDWSYPSPEDSTHGVDTSIVLDINGTITHIWDFGGQVIYHASHRFFLYANCIYILVINARTEDNRDINRLNYWLDTINIYSDYRAKVFIVLNESDNRRQNVKNFDSFKYGKFASSIQDIYSFNIGNDMEKVNTFKNDLATYIEKTGYQAFGQNDSAAMKDITALFNSGKKVLKISELEEILQKNNITSEQDQNRAKELFNTLGVALSYDIVDGYILDPYWISHGVYKVIDYLQKNETMFISDNDLCEVFANELTDYPFEQQRYILSLMEHHNIGFREVGGIGGLFVPCAASQFRPRDITVETDHDCLVTNIERDNLEEFPADFFYKYICVNKNDIKTSTNHLSMWQTGMVLEKSLTSALVELKENRRIVITVWGVEKKEYSKKLENLIIDLLHEYRFLQHVEKKRNIDGRQETWITLASMTVAKNAIKAFAQPVGGTVAKWLFNVVLKMLRLKW